jgi:hypothetical protein
MALDKPDTVDAVGIERESGLAVLTIADEQDWSDESGHLLALQKKLNGYFEFIESGQVYEAYPAAVGKPLAIDVVGRFPLPEVATAFLERASEVAADLDVLIRWCHHPDPAPTTSA